MDPEENLTDQDDNAAAAAQPVPPDLSSMPEDVQKLVTGILATQTEQLNRERDALLRQNKLILNEKKDLTKKFKDVDVDEYLRLKNTFDSSEDAKLIAEGKLDDVISRRTERQRLEYQEQFNALEEDKVLLKEQNATLTQAYDTFRVKLALQAEAQKQGVLSSAVDDVIFRAQSHAGFIVESDGTVIAKNKDGSIATTQDGKTLTPASFIQELKADAPHLWAPSKSADLSGSSAAKVQDSLETAASSGDMQAFRKARQAQKVKTNGANQLKHG